MISGTVKFYNSERRFGMIVRADGEKDIRFHFDALKHAGVTGVEQGQKVKFDLLKNPDTGKITAGAIQIV